MAPATESKALKARRLASTARRADRLKRARAMQKRLQERYRDLVRSGDPQRLPACVRFAGMLADRIRALEEHPRPARLDVEEADPVPSHRRDWEAEGLGIGGTGDDG